MKRYLIVLFLTVLAIGLVYSSFAKTQNKIKRTVSEIHFHSKQITRPIEFSKLKIKGNKIAFSSMFEEGNKKLEKPINPEAEFEEDDTFWEQMSFDVKNISDKTIIYMNTNIYLYVNQELRDRQIVEWVESFCDERTTDSDLSICLSDLRYCGGHVFSTLQQ